MNTIGIVLLVVVAVVVWAVCALKILAEEYYDIDDEDAVPLPKNVMVVARELFRMETLYWVAEVFVAFVIALPTMAASLRSRLFGKKV